ncbi:glycosyltransferase [Dapis sp. BLCC M172]|uniref:glycosyltransferase n=1 Tax=Dapis sp. BLCC M172 TaxID=2975281 RepID=UPI003CF8437F
MRINWFCPLPPEKTDIAHYTNRILADLQKYADIVLWTDKDDWSPELTKYGEVRHYHPDLLPDTEIKKADINFYNIGNNAAFHGSIWKVSQQYPGIVIIHDVNLHYLFTTIFPEYLQPGSQQDAYIDLMVRCYGVFCKQDIEKLFGHNLTWSVVSERYPLTFAALENSLGVILHNHNPFTMVQQEQRWPVLYAPLPYPSTPISPVVKNSSRQRPPYQLIIFGYLGGTYRRVQSVIEALGTLPEKSLFRLDIYGQVWDKNYLDGLIERFNLQERVTLHGWVTESTLDNALANADLAINLRYPTGGEASGSQLRIWSHGLPALVTRIGWYAQIPENAVAFVNHDHEIADIQRQLQNFVADPASFARMGENGRGILATEHSPALYAQKILNFAREVISSSVTLEVTTKPQVSIVIYAYNCSQSISQTIESIMKQSYDDYEIIVVDDGSTDNIRKALEPYKSQIRYTRYQNYQGISVARNQGINMARGWLIVFLDGSDRLLPHLLASQVACFDTNPSLGWVCAGFRWVNELGEMLTDVEPWHDFPLLDWETFLVCKQLYMGAMMFEREWLEWVGGFKTELNYAQEIDLLSRLALINCSGDWSYQVAVERYQSPKVDSENILAMAKASESVLDNLFRNSELPEKASRKKERSLYHNLVWFAWNFYQAEEYQLMTEYLQKSLAYTNYFLGKSITSLVEKFKFYSLKAGYNFNAYNFTKFLDLIDLKNIHTKTIVKY